MLEYAAALRREEEPIGRHGEVRVPFLPVLRVIRIMCVVRIRITEVHHGGCVIERYPEYDVFDVTVALRPTRVRNPNGLDE